MSIRSTHLAAMVAALAMAAPPNPRRKFLMDRGWVPLGAEAFTGKEGWGKLIDGRAVTIDEDEALEIEGYKS